MRFSLTNVTIELDGEVGADGRLVVGVPTVTADAAVFSAGEAPQAPEPGPSGYVVIDRDAKPFWYGGADDVSYGVLFDTEERARGLPTVRGDFVGPGRVIACFQQYDPLPDAPLGVLLIPMSAPTQERYVGPDEPLGGASGTTAARGGLDAVSAWTEGPAFLTLELPGAVGGDA